jgi:hypothetical protein
MEYKEKGCATTSLSAWFTVLLPKEAFRINTSLIKCVTGLISNFSISGGDSIKDRNIKVLMIVKPPTFWVQCWML